MSSAKITISAVSANSARDYLLALESFPDGGSNALGLAELADKLRGALETALGSNVIKRSVRLIGHKLLGVIHAQAVKIIAERHSVIQINQL